MRLGLSSAAAADADVDTLLATCARRGLSALELRAEDEHGVSDAQSARAASHLAHDFGIRIAAYRVGTARTVDEIATVARALDASALIAYASLADRIAAACALHDQGIDALVEVNGPAEAWLPAVSATQSDVAWQLDESVLDMAGDVQRVLRTIPGRLRHVRLLGGGPETATADGRGVGALMGQLALARFDGTLVIAPSSNRFRVAWSAWLGRRGGWGCGSKADRDVVSLSASMEG